MVDLERREVRRARQRVIHERARQELTGGVVDDLFEERIAEAVRDAPVDLPLRHNPVGAIRLE